MKTHREIARAFCDAHRYLQQPSSNPRPMICIAPRGPWRRIDPIEHTRPASTRRSCSASSTVKKSVSPGHKVSAPGPMRRYSASELRRNDCAGFVLQNCSKRNSAFCESNFRSLQIARPPQKHSDGFTCQAAWTPASSRDTTVACIVQRLSARLGLEERFHRLTHVGGQLK
jgi:hypothetical protein